MQVVQEEGNQVWKFKHLGVHLSEGLVWGLNTRELVKKAQQRLFLLWTFMSKKLHTNFYQFTIGSVLS